MLCIYSCIYILKYINSGIPFDLWVKRNQSCESLGYHNDPYTMINAEGQIWRPSPTRHPIIPLDHEGKSVQASILSMNHAFVHLL